MTRKRSGVRKKSNELILKYANNKFSKYDISDTIPRSGRVNPSFLKEMFSYFTMIGVFGLFVIFHQAFLAEMNDSLLHRYAVSLEKNLNKTIDPELQKEFQEFFGHSRITVEELDQAIDNWRKPDDGFMYGHFNKTSRQLFGTTKIKRLR